MKSKMNYKSKRNLIIGLIAAVIVIAAIVGTVAYIKGNTSSQAAMEENNIENSQISNNIDKNTVTDNGGGTGPVVTPADNGNEGSTTEQQGNNDNANNTPANVNTNNDNNTTTNTNNAGGNNGTQTGKTNTPSKEYVQKTIIPNGGEERLVSEDEKMSWRPITVSAKTATADINVVKPQIESHKLAFINDDDINDEPIHSTVQRNDIITYVIQVVNHSEIEAKGVNIYDTLPIGTELIEGSISDNGTIKNGRISWRIDIPAKNEEEPIRVSFKVRVLLEDAEGNEITLIDNQAIVDGNPTEITHNPAVTAIKKVQVVANDGSLLDNQTVVPGTRLRYTIVLKNTTAYDGVTKVTDKIPEGTAFIEGSISEGGVLENGIITWETVKVPANSEAEVYFDVTVKNNTRQTVKNIAKIGNNDEPPVPEDPDNPDNPPYTNEVRTPVFIASKTSVLDGKTVRETNTVEYVITVTNVGNPDIEEENIAGTAKLNDKYWISDSNKMTFVDGIMVIKDKDGNQISSTNVDENFLKNIEVTLNAGETAVITYRATVNSINKEIPDEGTVTDDIANNLYWAKSEEDDEPSRPENPNDETNPGNPENPNDPTKPTPDPDDPDNETPIDTVIVNVEEKYIKVEAEKKWIDDDNKYGTRPENITFRLFRGYDIDNQNEDLNISEIGNSENNWKVEFTKLKESDANGRVYVYTVKEDAVKNYTTTYSADKLTVTNKYTNPIVNPTKKVEVVTKTEDGTVTTSALAPNAIVEPGTRLRYTITLTNTTEVDGYVDVEDNVPTGTTLYKEENISDGGVYSNGKITWNRIKVPAATAEGAGTASVSFDVTVNKNQTETVKNFATVTIPTIPDPEDPTPPGPTVITTPEVKTPVFVASKKSSSDYNAQTGTPKLHETNEVTYVVTVTNSANPEDADEKELTGTARLEDKFWISDLNKMTYKTGTLEIKNADGTVESTTSVEESFLANITVTLKPGQTATLTYVYEIKEMKASDITTETENDVTHEWDEISNNLYWAKPENGEPSRPSDTDDQTSYENVDGEDPTPATPDPDNPDQPALIDTVIIHVKEEYINIPVTKKWIDDSNEYGLRPENVIFRLFRGYDVDNQNEDLNVSKVLNGDNNEWSATFEHFRRTDANGRVYVYTVKEDAVKNYTTTYSADKLTVTNKYTNPIVNPTKKVEVVTKTEDGTVTTSALAPNAIVEPGTRLRYTITLTNTTEVDGYVDVEDNVPTGTTLYKEENISDGGVYSNGKITWNRIKVPAATAEGAGTASVSFDVTVNKNQTETVKNFATVTIPTIPDPEDPTPPGPTVITTPEVKTPVFVASKKSSSDYNAQTGTPKLHETNEVTYVVTVTNSANPEDADEKELTGTARLEDKFWLSDLSKMTYKTGTLEIKNADGTVESTTSVEESFLANITVTLKPGQTATLTYVYEIKEMKASDITTETENDVTYEWDEISNNLYWAKPENGEPSRPSDTDDQTSYENVDGEDPTPATPDPDNPDQPALIDTVIVHVEEEYVNIEATKAWDDNDDEFGKRPTSVQFTLFKDGNQVETLSPSVDNGWKVTFEHLRRTRPDGTAYAYTVKEANVAHYRDPESSYAVGEDNKVTITNIFGPRFTASKTSEQDGKTLEETQIITYTVTVKNIGKTTGTTTLRDVYRNNDKSKVTFVEGSITIDGTATTKPESYLDKMTLTLDPNQTMTITYQYKINVLDKESMTYANGKYTTTITNDLFWSKNNDTDPDDPDYPTDTPIDTVIVNVEKKFVSITATKVWNDSNNSNNQRPTKIAFILQDFASNSNGVDVIPKQEKILTSSNATASDANKWTVTFTDLPKYYDGHEAVYGVREEGIITENGVEVRKPFVRNYQTTYSSDHRTVTNTYKQDLTGKITITNVSQSTIPIDVVFVLDISSSMYTDSEGNTNYTTNRLSNMVKAVNEEIKVIMNSNSQSRVGIELFNSHAQKLLNLGRHTANSGNKYISYNNKVITLTVDGETKTVEVPTNAEYYKCGTYTQSGVFRATKDLFDTDHKTNYKATLENGETVSRTPVMILLTDGDPTHFDTNTTSVANEPPNTIYGNDTKSIGRVRYCRAEDYAYTMKTISTCKAWITSKYDKACKFYTIGLDMHGSMAKTLLNPTTANINKMNNISTSSSDTYSEIHNCDDDWTPHSVNSVKIKGNDLTYYQNNYNSRLVKEGNSYYLIKKNYYVWQQMRLYNILNGITTTNNGAQNTYGSNLKLTKNYTDKTFTSSMSATDMQNAFREAINLSSESISDLSLQQSNNRRYDLTGLDESKEFKIKIVAVDINGNSININKTFTTFTAALSDTAVKAYIKGSTGSRYLDFSNLRSGTIEVTYGKL